MRNNIGKNISKNLSRKYSQKLIDHAEQSATGALIAVSKSNSKSRRSYWWNIADKITKISNTSPQNSLDAVTIEAENTRFDRELPEERYISPENRQESIDDLRLI